MKIAIIDPSCFTMHYDYFLFQALAEHQEDVIFIGTRYLYDDFVKPDNFRYLSLFYNFSNYIYRYKSSGFFRKKIKGVEHIFNMFRLLNYLRKYKPNIIHFQWVPFPFVDSLFITYLRKIAPVILTVHDAHPYHNIPSSSLQLFRFSRIFRVFDHFIVHTKSSLKVLVEKWGVPENAISVIPHGLFDHYTKINSNEIKDISDNNWIVFFGTIKPYKGIDTLIKAYAKLPPAIKMRYKLLIAGLPRMDIRSLVKLAEELQVQNDIKWNTRFIPENEVPKILRKAAIFVLPYTDDFEAQSGALMALIGFGKPIIATNISCFAELLINGKTGYLVQPQNSEELAEALFKILNNPERQINMGQEVLKLAYKCFTWNDIAEKLCAIYKNLLQRRFYFKFHIPLRMAEKHSPHI